MSNLELGIVMVVAAVGIGALPFVLHRWCIDGRFP